MDLINVANKAFSRNSVKQLKVSGPSLQEIDSKILESRNKMADIRNRVNEIQESWKTLCEDYQCMSFYKVFDTTVKESMQKAIDDLKIEYDDAKSTLAYYKDLKNKTLLEADERIPKDKLFNPDSNIDLRDIAAKADKEEKEAKERDKYRSLGEEVYEELVDAYDTAPVFDLMDIVFDAFIPNSGKAHTVGAEAVRAISRLIYRAENDGDVFYDGYGVETCGDAAAYLMQIFKGQFKEDLVDIIENELTDREYVNALVDIAANIIKFLIDNPELLWTPNRERYEDADMEELNDLRPTYEWHGFLDSLVNYWMDGTVSTSNIIQDIADWFNVDYRNIEIDRSGDVTIDCIESYQRDQLDAEWDDFLSDLIERLEEQEELERADEED